MNTLVKFLVFTFLFGNNHPWHTSLNILIRFSRDALLSGVNETILLARFCKVNTAVSYQRVV